jgi:shikimate kinase
VRVLLVGLMGTGKTTLGRLLADRLDCPYLDNDELVRRARGAALEELLQRGGERALREAEAAALAEALRTPAPVVAGVAAGVVLDPANRMLMTSSDACVVWLRARPQTLLARIGADPDRPWLRPDPLAVLTRMAAERDPWYAQVADVTLDVDDLAGEQAADAVLAALPG